MKNINVQLIQKLIVFAIALFSLNLSVSYAQIGPSPNATNTPNYGIYGSGDGHAVYMRNAN